MTRRDYEKIMEQITLEIQETIAEHEPREITRTEKNDSKSNFYLNKRSDGFCDACCKDFPPGELIRNSNSTSHNGTEIKIISYLCARCSA